MVIYYQYLLDLYSRLDTGMINNLKGQKVERDFFVERIAFFALNNSSLENRKKIIEELVSKERPTPLMIESYSKELMSAGDTAGAYRVIKNALVKTNYDNDIFNVLVNYYLSINKEEKLMEEIQGQIQENPNSRIYWIRGYLNEKTQKYDEATADYRKSRELDEFNYDANWNLGVCLMKYETRKLLDGKSPSDPAAKAKLEQQRLMLFQDAKGFLEFALENPDYSKTELKDISKALRTCCLELNDSKCAGDYRDKIRELEGFSLSVGDKFTYQIDGNSNNMEISYQNNRNTVSSISLKADVKKGISVDKEFIAAGWVKNGYVWQKEFDYTEKSDMLSLSVRVNDESTVKGLILVNGVMVAEKEVDGPETRFYIQF
jgi:tetratricopeptide (TPR) repeat protein